MTDQQATTPDKKNQRLKKRNVNRYHRLKRRNYAVITRYYYWTEIKRRRFDDVIRILSENEFFVEERTIHNAIAELQPLYSKLYNGTITIRQLRQEFPGWLWD